MKARNLHIHNADQTVLERLAEDYTYLGREVKLEQGHLTVFARKAKPVKKKVDRKPKSEIESTEQKRDREQRPKRRD